MIFDFHFFLCDDAIDKCAIDIDPFKISLINKENNPFKEISSKRDEIFCKSEFIPQFECDIVIGTS